ncbi:MAG: LolA family protein [Planctomycetota bacterium]
MPRTAPRRVLWLFVAALFLGCAAHATGTESPAPKDKVPRLEDLPARLQSVLRKVDEQNENLKNVRARVRYERKIPLLDERETSSGSLIFEKPDHIALELGEPRNEAVYTNGEKWWVVDHDAEQVEIYEAAEDEKRGREAAFLDFGYGRGAEALLKDYEIELVGTETKERKEHEGEETLYRLKFVPRPREGRPSRYAAVEVMVSDARWLPHELVLHESEGEIIHTYRLAEIKTNTEIDDEDVFRYDPPRGYTVLHPERF